MTQLRTGKQISHLVTRGLALSLLAGLCLAPTLATAQTKSKRPSTETDKITGTVASVKKGRPAKITVTKEDGETLEVSILPKTAFAVVAPGDVSSLVPNHLVSGRALINNDRLFVNAFTVYVGIKQDVGLQKDPDSPSECDICGVIKSVDGESLMVDLGGQIGTVPVLFEQAATVKVTINAGDPSLATEGAAIELEGTTRVGRFLPSRITVTLTESLDAEELFGASKSGSKSKTTSSKTSKSKSASKDGDATDAGGKGTPTAADPFGVIKKKEATKGKTATPEKSDEKKESTSKKES